MHAYVLIYLYLYYIQLQRLYTKYQLTTNLRNYTPTNICWWIKVCFHIASIQQCNLQYGSELPRMPRNILKPNCWLYPVNVNKAHACQCQHWPITYLIHEWSLTKCRSNLVTSKFGWLNIDSDQHHVFHGTEKSIYTHTQLQNCIRIYGAARVWAAPPGVSIVSALQLWIARDHPSLSRCQP